VDKTGEEGLAKISGNSILASYEKQGRREKYPVSGRKKAAEKVN